MTIENLNETCLIHTPPQNGRVIVISDNKNTLKINNPEQKTIREYDVDGCLLSSETFPRCDRLCEIENSDVVR